MNRAELLCLHYLRVVPTEVHGACCSANQKNNVVHYEGAQGAEARMQVHSHTHTPGGNIVGRSVKTNL